MPSAVMLVGTAALTILAGAPTTVVTSIVPLVKSVAVASTVAVPMLRVDCNSTVASPAAAGLVVVPNKLPSPDTENVTVFVAVVVVLSSLLVLFHHLLYSSL